MLDMKWNIKCSIVTHQQAKILVRRILVERVIMLHCDTLLLESEVGKWKSAEARKMGGEGEDKWGHGDK